MRIAAEKYASFEMRPTKDSWQIANPDLCLSNGVKINQQQIVPISPWSGMRYNDLVAQFLKHT
jgi:hypothetical protein